MMCVCACVSVFLSFCLSVFNSLGTLQSITPRPPPATAPPPLPSRFLLSGTGIWTGWTASPSYSPARTPSSPTRPLSSPTAAPTNRPTDTGAGRRAGSVQVLQGSLYGSGRSRDAVVETSQASSAGVPKDRCVCVRVCVCVCARARALSSATLPMTASIECVLYRMYTV